MKANIVQTNSGGLQRIIDRISASSKKSLNVGVPEGKMHSDDGESLSMSALANIHEYGSPSRNIVARPFLVPALEKNQAKYAKFLASQVIPLIRGKTTIDRILGQLGMVAQADVQAYMVSGHFVPLYYTTIKRKGSSKPLIDTGQLRQSITYSIEGR